MQTEWRSFQGGAWETEVNVRDFIQKNYHPYDGDDSFLEGPTQDTTDLWDQVLTFQTGERSRRSAGYGHKDHFHDHFPWSGLFR